MARRSILFVVGVVACGTGSASPIPASSPSPVLEARDAAPPAAPPGSLGPKPACKTMSWVEGACWIEPAFGPAIEDYMVWITSHGGNEADVSKLELASCNETAVGPDHEAAMICSYGFGTMAGITLTGLKIVTVRKHRVVVLLDALYEIGDMPVAPGPDDPNAGPPFALTVDLSHAEREIRFTEPKPGACAFVRSGMTHEDAEAATQSPPVRKMLADARKEILGYIDNVCANARTFTWTGGTYRRGG